jgi:lipopolysaccharide export LptBFGC system permease protein LptF
MRRLGGRFLLLLAVFVGVVGGGQIGIFLGRGVPPEALLPVIPSMLLMGLSVALPLAMTTAVLVCIGGMQQDGEIQALASAGIDHRAVVWRMAPVVLAAVVLAAVLSHVVMPAAMAEIRDNKERFLQAGVATRVVRQQPIIDQDGVTAWAGSASGQQLGDVYLHQMQNGQLTAVFAPQARWTLSDTGIALELQDVSMVQRGTDGRVVAGTWERWSVWQDPGGAGRITRCDQCGYEFPRTGPEAVPRGAESATCPLGHVTYRHLEPDSMSTPRLVRELAQVDPAKDRSQYNNARLAMHLRFFVPLALIAFALFAAGLALMLGTADNLPAVAMVVVLVTVMTYPAVGYVKTNVDEPQISPGWLLWPPVVALGAVGWIMVRRPDRVRQVLGNLSWQHLVRLVRGRR